MWGYHDSSSYSIHVWCIYLRLVDFYGKCRQIMENVPYMDSMGRSTSHCKIKPPNIWLSSLVIQESEINYHRGHYTTNQNNALLHNNDKRNISRSDLETSQLYPNSLANWIKTTPVNGLQLFFPSIFRGPNIFRPKKNQWNVPTYRTQFHLQFSGSLYPTSWTPTSRSATWLKHRAWLDWLPAKQQMDPLAGSNCFNLKHNAPHLGAGAF